MDETIGVTEEFVKAVLLWIKAVEGGASTATENTALFEVVKREGFKLLRSGGRLEEAVRAVLEGRYQLFLRGGVLRSPLAGDVGLEGLGGEAGAATAGGLAAGLAVSAAVLLISLGVYVWVCNKRDLAEAKREALYHYEKSYLPHYIKLAIRILSYGHNVPPPVLSFDEFYEMRGEGITHPHG
jgi:hypothetical protein